MAKLIYCFIFFFLVSCYNTPSLSCPYDQKQALLNFKNSLEFRPIDGADFRVFSSWNSASNCCEWERVTCDSTSPTSQVIALDLSSTISQSLWSVSISVLRPLFFLHSLRFLNLSGNVLTGAIPGLGLSNLTQLAVLDICVNKLTGPIPPQLFYLRKLRYLDLSYNFLHGEIPVEIGNLTELRELYLSVNSFLGVIPPQLFSLSKLMYLCLDRNSFHGEIPVEIGNLTELRELYLLVNSFHGEIPMEMGNLTNLQALSMGSNNFIGNIPVQLYYLRKLWGLNLSLNLLHGEIPTEISNLTNLKYLLLHNNNFSGRIPLSFRRLDKLITLDLRNNILSGEVTWLFDYQYIESLAIGGNNLSLGKWSIVPKGGLFLRQLSLASSNLEGEIPFWLSNIKNLQFLNLGSNYLKGNIPDQFDEMNLQYLDLSHNRFHGSVPPRLFKSQNLSCLDLSHNALSGNLPNSIGEASSLVSFSVASNKFSGKIPAAFPAKTEVLDLSNNEFSDVLASIKNLSRLRYLDVHSNNITGEIPQFLSQNHNLFLLNLRNNSFSGKIPQNLSKLINLQFLDLSSNKINGAIPDNWGKLKGMIDNSYPFLTPSEMYARRKYLQFLDTEVFWKSLEQNLHNITIYTFLDLSNNQLRGEIPNSLSALKSLKALNISRNKLSGNIPATFGNLRNIESLDLSHNNLSGKIPLSFGKLSQLTILDLSNNKLTGKIPNGPQMDTMDDPNSYANNSELCGMQILVPCENIEQPKTVESERKEEKDKKRWFSWEMAGIGYPFGFVTTVVALYVSGYFIVAPRRSLRQHVWFQYY